MWPPAAPLARSAPTASAMGWSAAATAFILNQGQFTGRPSKLRVLPEGTANRVETVKVGGDVAFVGHGVLEALP